MKLVWITSCVGLLALATNWAQAKTAPQPAPGKYGCTSSRYNASTKFYEFTPHGSIALSSSGAYSYLAFEKPSVGSYKADAASGKLVFAGGYLRDGEATPIEGQSNRFYLVFPTIMATGANRWTCGLK